MTDEQFLGFAIIAPLAIPAFLYYFGVVVDYLLRLYARMCGVIDRDGNLTHHILGENQSRAKHPTSHRVTERSQ